MSIINFESLAIRSTPSSSGIDAFINAYTSYLEFIKALPHISASQVTYPPESGWSNFSVTEQQLSRLGKSDAVIKLLRYIPQADTAVKIAGNTTQQVTWRDDDHSIKELVERSDSEVQVWFTNNSGSNPPECSLNANQVAVTFGGEEEINLVVDCATGK